MYCYTDTQDHKAAERIAKTRNAAGQLYMPSNKFATDFYHEDGKLGGGQGFKTQKEALESAHRFLTKSPWCVVEIYRRQDGRTTMVCKGKKSNRTGTPPEADLPKLGEVVTLRFDGPNEVVGYSKWPDHWSIHLREVGSEQKETLSCTIAQFRRSLVPTA